MNATRLSISILVVACVYLAAEVKKHLGYTVLGVKEVTSEAS